MATMLKLTSPTVASITFSKHGGNAPSLTRRRTAALAHLDGDSLQALHGESVTEHGEPALSSDPELQHVAARRLRASLTRAGIELLTEQFVKEVRKLLSEQELALPLLASTKEWALGSLYKRFSSIRAAALMLEQRNIATVAARGEVLVCLLSQELLVYQPLHLEILEDTLHLLRGIIDRIERDGSDARCYSTARTCLCLYAAAVPQTQGYQPS